MSVAETFDPTSIMLSARAAQKVRERVEEADNEELKLRVFITGGGCSGFQYGFTFDEKEVAMPHVADSNLLNESFPARSNVLVLHLSLLHFKAPKDPQVRRLLGTIA